VYLSSAPVERVFIKKVLKRILRGERFDEGSPAPEPDATFARLMHGSEQNIVIGRRISLLLMKSNCIVRVNSIFTWKRPDCGWPIVVKHVNGKTLI
jgi:hypothetical protein